MHTRQDYLNGLCTHAEYYSQFVTEQTIERVVAQLGTFDLKRSTDPHMNDIPLRRWDNLTFPVKLPAMREEAWDYYTLIVHVCIAKQAARMWLEKQS